MFRDRLQCLGTALAQGVAGSGTHREQWLPVLMARGCAKERMCCVSGGGRYGTLLLTQQQGLSVEPQPGCICFPVLEVLQRVTLLELLECHTDHIKRQICFCANKNCHLRVENLLSQQKPQSL